MEFYACKDRACFPVSKVPTLQSLSLLKHETSEEPFSDDHGGSNHSAKVEPANGCTGERETGKSAKKLGLQKRRHPNVRSCKFELEIAREAAPFVDPAVLVETYEQEECVDDLEGDDWIQSALAHIVTHALLKMLLDLVF
ncbi:unnamed protein product [Prunus armeniaca]